MLLIVVLAYGASTNAHETAGVPKRLLSLGKILSNTTGRSYRLNKRHRLETFTRASIRLEVIDANAGGFTESNAVLAQPPVLLKRVSRNLAPAEKIHLAQHNEAVRRDMALLQKKMEGANPNWGGTDNCVNCALVGEQRMGGDDKAVAQPSSKKSLSAIMKHPGSKYGLFFHIFADLYHTLLSQPVGTRGIMVAANAPNPKATVEKILTEVTQNGRAYINATNWESGHAFNFVKMPSGLFFPDFQETKFHSTTYISSRWNLWVARITHTE